MLQAALLAGAPLPFAEGQGEGREEGMAAEPVAKKSKVGIREEGRAGGGQLYTYALTTCPAHLRTHTPVLPTCMTLHQTTPPPLLPSLPCPVQGAGPSLGPSSSAAAALGPLLHSQEADAVLAVQQYEDAQVGTSCTHPHYNTMYYTM